MATCAVTGTIGDGAVETDVKNTGGTVILTLTGDTWIAAAGGILLSYDAEGYSDGDNLSAAGWTGDNSDRIEIDTAYYHGGAASIKIQCDTTSASVTKTFASQSSTFRVSQWIMASGIPTNPVYFMSINSGATSAVFIYLHGADRVIYVVDGAGVADTTFSYSDGQWFHVELEINPATDTFRIKINDTEYLVGTTLDFESSVASCDTYKISTYSGSAYNVWLDDIVVTEGGW